METWHRVQLDGAPDGGPTLGHVPGADGRPVLLVRSAGRLHALDPACPHLGNPLTRGEVEGGSISCRQHWYRYRLDDGRCVAPGGPLAGRLAVHEVRERDGDVEVRFAVRQAPAS